MPSHEPLELPPLDEINAQLERIIASPEFCVPERDHFFLRYIVGEAVAGRGDRLKAYGIAIEVFARSEAFDAQNDPVVRIEAGRLRRALERYYLVAGFGDEILIDIPKGGYRPTFTMRKQAPTISGRREPGEPGRTARPLWERRKRLHRLALATAALGVMLIGAFLVAAPATGRLNAQVIQHTLSLVTAPCKNEVVSNLVCRRSGR